MGGADLPLPEVGPAVVAFTAPWCHNCRRMAPSLGAAAAEHPRVRLVEVDVESSPEVATRFAVRSVPTLIGLDDGAELVRAVGDRPAAALNELFVGLETGTVSAVPRASLSLLVSRAAVGSVFMAVGALLGRPVLIVLGIAILAWALWGLVPLVRR